ncbi:MAG TPA: hypothetical protein DCY42_07665, partial [Chloroflexi bacterium]|nr:hypothetical protein [Chloroflexota bacterium]
MFCQQEIINPPLQITVQDFFNTAVAQAQKDQSIYLDDLIVRTRLSKICQGIQGNIPALHADQGEHRRVHLLCRTQIWGWRRGRGCRYRRRSGSDIHDHIQISEEILGRLVVGLDRQDIFQAFSCQLIVFVGHIINRLGKLRS